MKSRQLTGSLVISDEGMVFEPDDYDQPVVSVPRSMVRGKLVDSDKVRVSLRQVEKYGRFELEDVEVLARNREIIGEVNAHQRVVPLHDVGQDEIMLVPTEQGGKKPGGKKLTSGDVVAVKLLAPQKDTDIVCGEVTEIFDYAAQSNMEIEVALRTFDIPSRWNEEALREAEEAAAVPVSDCLKGRQDLRQLNFFTIDGEDAKDFDDAIFCEPAEDGWKAAVAIADVASYVCPDGALDKAALERGNSVYFPNYVVPMLPPILSDRVCSLRPHEDRLALVCRFEVSAEGKVGAYEFVTAVIRSKARLTYTEVGKFFAGEDKLSKYPREIKDVLSEARRIFSALYEQRKKRGALELDVPAAQLICDKRGQVRAIVSQPRNDAHRLIEEFMISANVCAADYLTKHNKTLPYRVHSGLKEDVFTKFSGFFRQRDITVPQPKPQSIAAMLEETQERSDSRVIQMLILRFLAKALYQTKNIGHFGLALDQYTHFTSPIRRYSDLLVHRAIHASLGSDNGKTYAQDRLDDIGEHLCLTEQRANEATYDIEKFLKCTYASKHTGKTFDGIITGVTSFGLFVTLNDLYVDGLLHISDLGNDYYDFDEPQQHLVGRREGRLYALGDSICVSIEAIDPVERKIDLMPAQT